MKGNTIFTIFISLGHLCNLDNSVWASHQLADVSYIPLVSAVLQFELVHYYAIVWLCQFKI